MSRVGLLERVLDSAVGKLHFYISLDDTTVAEVLLEGKLITVVVKNPVLALEAILKEVMEHKTESDTIERIKAQGYKVKIKYGRLEVTL